MGIGSFIGQIIIFFSTIMIIMFLMYNYTDYVGNRYVELNVEKEKSLESRANITILNASFVNSNLLNITINNTGKQSFDDITKFDLYVDGNRIDSNHKTTYMQSENDIINPGIFEIKEILIIEASDTFSQGNHKIRVSTEKGIYTEATATVS